mmetsp:Transcript_16319/g.19938  ORF Transcript_16319/g.19938 Transcript_16319/m.19938 type:complete len:122 (+) Transcript_16319:123-488(+)
MEESNAEVTFVNTGLQRWEDGRNQWLNYGATSANLDATSAIHNKRTNDEGCCLPSSKKKRNNTSINLNVDKIIDLVVSNRWRAAAKGGKKEKDKATFDKPVPLPQMVDILVDLWEAEGMDI